MCSQRLARFWGSIPVEGSSKNTNCGRCIRPSATSSRRRWPPDSVLTRRLPKVVRSRVSISSVARLAESLEFIP